jgi:signal transduction histidine kinase
VTVIHHNRLHRRIVTLAHTALAVLAIALLLLALFEYRAGYGGSPAVLVATTLGASGAVTALLVVAILYARLRRAGHFDAERAEATMAAMTEGVLCADGDGRLSYINPAAQDMLRVSFRDYADKALSDVFPLVHRDGSGADEDLVASVSACKPYAGRDSVVCGDGGILPVDVHFAPITVRGKHAGAVLTFADDRERSREEQSKDDFVGFASHELRSPLTAMLGFSSWLAKKLEQEPWRFDVDTAEAIAALTSETGRMESIIELFLDLTQIRMDRLTLKSDLSDLTELLRQESAAVRSRYPAAEVDLSLPSTRVLAIVDEQRLRQVLLNLLDNAAKYGGTSPSILLTLLTSDTIVEVHVKDFGSGIPLEDQPHIFERFFRSSAPATGRKTGFGIGLYVTKQIVDRMGGELSFVSEEGRGTEFILRLPLIREEELFDADSVPTVESVLLRQEG